MEKPQPNPNLLRFKSASGNDYLYSRSIPQVLFLHPVLNYLLGLAEQGISVKEWLDTLEVREIEIDEGVRVKKEELTYYYGYMRFLEKNRYFEEIQTHPMTDTRYTVELVKRRLANTQQIVFEVTNRCNLKCTYCGYGELYSGYDDRQDESLNLKTAQNVLEYMVNLFDSATNRKSHKKIAVSFYGGEPLLNMPFVKNIVDYVNGRKLNNKGFMFSITTNGVLLDKYMDYFVDNDFLLSISLDGGEKNNEYRKFHNGDASFEIVFKNISMLKKKYPRYFETSVNFLSVLHDKNSNKEVNAFFSERFGKEPIISEVNSIGIKPEKRQDYDRIFKRMYTGLEPQDIIDDVKDRKRMMRAPFVKRLAKFIHHCSGFVYKSYHKLQYPQKKERHIFTGTCDPFEKKIFITAKGDILPCERIHQAFSLGKVDETGIHLDFQAIANQYNAYYKKIMEQCNRCSDGANCPLCIFTMNLKDEKVTCKYFKTAEAFREGYTSSISLLEETPRYYPKIMRDYTLN